MVLHVLLIDTDPGSILNSAAVTNIILPLRVLQGQELQQHHGSILIQGFMFHALDQLLRPGKRSNWIPKLPSPYNHLSRVSMAIVVPMSKQKDFFPSQNATEERALPAHLPTPNPRPQK
jgi:hypothetical protein